MGLNQNPQAFEKKILAMIDGLQQEFPPSSQQVVLGGQRMTLAQVHARLKEIADLLSAVHQALASYRQAVATRDAAIADARSFYEDGVLFVRQQFGRGSSHVATFGLAASKPRRSIGVHAMAIAKAKAAATRLLRGTMGRNQRASITLAGEPALYVFGADGKPLPGQTPVPATTAPTKAEADDTEEIEPKPTGLE